MTSLKQAYSQKIRAKFNSKNNQTILEIEAC
jgi:hypothetical protein